MKDIPYLCASELEALALLAEECAESVAIIGKALRHGLSSCHPDSGAINRVEIAKELGQVRCAIEIACQLGVIFSSDVMRGAEEKWNKVGSYLHHIEVDSVSRVARGRK